MTSQQLERPPGHVFVSYVREDSEKVDRLVALLDDAGIRVWRDTEDLWPGADWKAKIREAIGKEALAFVACLSSNSHAKGITYQNEELRLAVEQWRLRQPGTPWLIPVRFDDCELPDFEMGAGRTFADLQALDLIDPNWSKAGRLIRVITEVLTTKKIIAVASEATTTLDRIAPRLKAMLLDPAQEIEVEDLVDLAVADARHRLEDEEEFPTYFAQRPETQAADEAALVSQIRNYATVMKDLIEILIVGGAYGKGRHDGLWARAVQRLATTSNKRYNGRTDLLNMRRISTSLAVIATCLGATHRKNWGPFKAATTDAISRLDGRIEPVITIAHPWAVFGDGNGELAGVALADIQARGPGHAAISPGRRYTGPSDLMEELLRPASMEMLHFDDDDYHDLFMRTESMLSLVAADEARKSKERGGYQTGAWAGSWVWRDRRARPEDRVEQRLVDELSRSGPAWPPLAAGMFDGLLANAQQSAEVFLAESLRHRSRIM